MYINSQPVFHYSIHSKGTLFIQYWCTQFYLRKIERISKSPSLFSINHVEQSGLWAEGQSRVSAILETEGGMVVLWWYWFRKKKTATLCLISFQWMRAAFSCGYQKLELTLELIKGFFQMVPRSFGTDVLSMNQSRSTPSLKLYHSD